MKKTFLLVAVMALMAMGVYADSPAKVPAYRGLIERVQPNGDTLRTYETRCVRICEEMRIRISR